MKLYVPEIGDVLKLAKPWDFTLHHESRNTKFFDHLVASGHITLLPLPDSTWVQYGMVAMKQTVIGKGLWNRDLHDVIVMNLVTGKRIQYTEDNNTLFYIWDCELRECPLTLPADTELIVDRIYIRNGAKEYSSLTFRIGNEPGLKNMSKKRFWAKLADVNNMDIQ